MKESTNPYHLPSEMTNLPSEMTNAPRKSPLRFIAAAIVGLFGLAAFAIGTVAVMFTYESSFARDDTMLLIEVIVACVLYLSLGICWLLSAVLICRAEYRRAVTSGMIGLAIAVVMFAIDGF